MMEIRQWLQKTTASDVMARNVVSLRSDETMARAAELFLKEQLTGAPVVDDSGKCVGVLSVTDLAGAETKVDSKRAEIASSSLFASGLTLPESVYEERLLEVRDEIIPSSDQPIRQFMTSDVVGVRGDTPLAVIIQDMIDAHIHRVVVLDENRKLLGIISTTNILAALLRAAQ
jgi:CBS-domain-containing membrane protein